MVVERHSPLLLTAQLPGNMMNKISAEKLKKNNWLMVSTEHLMVSE
jgi:hypothetical protein